MGKLEDIKEIHRNIVSNLPPVAGGLIVEKSHCCNAPLEYTEGGLKMRYCSKCKKIHEDILYR